MHEEEVHEVAPKTQAQGTLWKPGAAPSQVLVWAVKALAKAGTLAVIGVYPETARFFPIGLAMGKNLTINVGNCNHRRYIPKLIDVVLNGAVKPERLISDVEPLTNAMEAYRTFDQRKRGWVKVELRPAEERAPGRRAERVVAAH